MWLSTYAPYSSQLEIGLCIIYFKRYDTYHNTHEAIFDMYQRYMLSGFRPKKIDISTNFSILMAEIS